MNKTLIYLCLILGLAAGAFVRLKDIDAPLADWHSFRQADTASVAREYVKHGIDLLRPAYHDLSSIQSGLDNPSGHRMVEFPLISALVAFLYTAIQPELELHVFYRLVQIALSLISSVFLFLILKKIANQTIGLFAALVFLFLPFNIFYSRTILPEVGMVSFSLMGIYFGLRYIDRPSVTSFIPAAITLAIGLLLKPVAIFFYLPVLGYAIEKRGILSVLNWRLILLGFAALAPVYFWRQWILQFPAGIPDSIWLLNGNDIRFKGAFFYWLFADRIGRLMLGYYGVVLIILGIAVKKKTGIISWWLTGNLMYLIVFATGNVQHDYYQIPLIPLLSLLAAYGIHFLLTNTTFSRLTSIFLLLTSIFFCISFSWYHIRAYYGINNPAIVAAGAAVDRLTPPDAQVIAPYMGDTAFLYQTNRRGWPIGHDVEVKIAKGATYYVSVNFDDETNELINSYTVVEKNDTFVIIDLTQPSD